MKTYIGTKIVKMEPMTQGEYYIFRGWSLPSDMECGDPAGYLVEYTDGGKPNVAGHEGYVSWWPKQQAEATYRETSGLTFGLAIEAMKKGMRVARAGWNGKEMWLEFVITESWIAVRTHDKKLFPWLASQTDMLAEDWQIV